MPLFHFARNRKVHHRLMFDRQSLDNRLPAHERMALFVVKRPAPSQSAGEKNKVNKAMVLQRKQLIAK